MTSPRLSTLNPSFVSRRSSSRQMFSFTRAMGSSDRQHGRKVVAKQMVIPGDHPVAILAVDVHRLVRRVDQNPPPFLKFSQAGFLGGGGKAKLQHQSPQKAVRWQCPPGCKNICLKTEELGDDHELDARRLKLAPEKKIFASLHWQNLPRPGLCQLALSGANPNGAMAAQQPSRSLRQSRRGSDLTSSISIRVLLTVCAHAGQPIVVPAPLIAQDLHPKPLSGVLRIKCLP